MEVTQRKRILIVDDDPDLVDRVTQLLEDDYEVHATTDWGEMNQQLFRVGCDLVLLDVNLPVLRGDKLAAILGRQANRARIVLFSSEDEDSLRRMCLEAGAAGYLSKSLRGQDLLARVGQLLA